MQIIENIIATKFLICFFVFFSRFLNGEYIFSLFYQGVYIKTKKLYADVRYKMFFNYKFHSKKMRCFSKNKFYKSFTLFILTSTFARNNISTQIIPFYSILHPPKVFHNYLNDGFFSFIMHLFTISNLWITFFLFLNVTL